MTKCCIFNVFRNNTLLCQFIIKNPNGPTTSHNVPGNAEPQLLGKLKTYEHVSISQRLHMLCMKRAKSPALYKVKA